MSFLEQFDKIYRKAVERFGLLHRVRQKLSSQGAETIYKSMAKPLLAYCDAVLLCLSASNSKRLEKLQERAGKSIYGRSSSARRWPSLVSKRKRQAILFTYKCMNSLGSDLFFDYFERVHHGKMTRVDNINLKLPISILYLFVHLLSSTQILESSQYYPDDFITKVKQINSQSDLISMSSFAGLSYLTIRFSVCIILI